jgi:hypothetical protein
MALTQTNSACPRCRSPHVDEQQQTGSSQRWFDCCNCGHRWALSARELAAPPKAAVRVRPAGAR